MRSLRFMLVLMCLGCEATPPASDATTDTTAADTAALDTAAADALDATLLADVVGIADAPTDARDAPTDARDALDVADALDAADAVDASSCPTATQRACNGACIDTSSDDYNCGVCGFRCPTGTTCRRGDCPAACLVNEEICGNCQPGRSSVINCGG